MSFAKIYTRGLLGLHAPLIEVEVHLSHGLPSLTIVGLAEAAVRESKDRVRSAIINSGFQFPTKRLTINLAPADLPKDGSRLDLPIALGILIASGQLPEQAAEQLEFIGELALDGHLRPVSGTLSIAIACQHAQHQLILPEQNAQEAAQLPDFTVFAAKHLKDVCEHLRQTAPLAQYAAPSSSDMPGCRFDLADVKGQLRPRRALEIAAAGGHSLLFRGPPGHRQDPAGLAPVRHSAAAEYAGKSGSRQHLFNCQRQARFWPAPVPRPAPYRIRNCAGWRRLQSQARRNYAGAFGRAVSG